MDHKPRVGISACLLGQRVRHNGEHKCNDWIVDSLTSNVHFVPLCPELEMGLGVPRETMRLILMQKQERPQMVTTRTALNLTQLADTTAEKILSKNLNLDAFIFKKDSPSCGLERVKVYDKNMSPTKSGVGLFAEKVCQMYPDLPVIEEGRLSDLTQREHFLIQVFAYHRLRHLTPKMSELQKFHQSYKLILMAYSPVHYQSLGQMVGNAKKLSANVLLKQYTSLFMEALRLKTTRAKVTNVLLHMFGYFKKDLEKKEKSQILEYIEEYRREEVPLIVPLTFIRHLSNKFGVQYLEGQAIFQPYPKKLSKVD